MSDLFKPPSGEFAPLPPLQVGKRYVAADFERFEFFRGLMNELAGGRGEATVRCHLQNGTILDLPTSEDELKRLLLVLMQSFPAEAVKHVKERWPSEL